MLNFILKKIVFIIFIKMIFYSLNVNAQTIELNITAGKIDPIPIAIAEFVGKDR